MAERIATLLHVSDIKANGTETFDICTNISIIEYATEAILILENSQMVDCVFYYLDLFVQRSGKKITIYNVHLLFFTACALVHKYWMDDEIAHCDLAHLGRVLPTKLSTMYLEFLDAVNWHLMCEVIPIEKLHECILNITTLKADDLLMRAIK
jgi:hypothetical protein